MTFSPGDRVRYWPAGTSEPQPGQWVVVQYTERGNVVIEREDGADAVLAAPSTLWRVPRYTLHEPDQPEPTPQPPPRLDGAQWVMLAAMALGVLAVAVWL